MADGGEPAPKRPRLAAEPAAASSRREKSATREALLLLQEVRRRPHLQSLACCFEPAELAAERPAAPALDSVAGGPSRRQDSACVASAGNEGPAATGLHSTGPPMLAKIATMGVAFIALPMGSAADPAATIARILAEVEAGKRPPARSANPSLAKEESGCHQRCLCGCDGCQPDAVATLGSWCHRITPVQATCAPTPVALRGAVMRTLAAFLACEAAADLPQPLKFGVQHKGRGPAPPPTLPHVAADAKDALGAEDGDLRAHGGDQAAVFQRGPCIALVAAVVAELAAPLGGCAVDLLAPDVVVMVEVLPLAGRDCEAAVTVSVLPAALVATKPRLAMRPIGKSGHSKSKMAACH
eukprot:SM000410S15568  [mRNA]  locus=s410:22059:24180:+ [translate_table: standard]